jgi:hypothetical protein
VTEGAIRPALFQFLGRRLSRKAAPEVVRHIRWLGDRRSQARELRRAS